MRVGVNKEKLLPLIYLVPLIAFIIVPLIVKQRYVYTLLTEIVIFMIFAISFNILFGFTGIVSIGHAAYFGTAAYISALLVTKLEIHIIISILIVLILSVLLSLCFSGLTLRLKGSYFTLVTMAFAQMIYYGALKWNSLTGGDDGLFGIFPSGFLASRENYYFFTLIIFVLVFAFQHRFVVSPTGKILRAIKENEDRVKMLGYNVIVFKTTSIILSGIIASIAGVLYGCFINFVYPSLLGIDTSSQVLEMVMIGGQGTLEGPLVGAFIIKILSHLLSSQFRQWPIIIGVVFIIVVVFMPNGIVGLLKNKTRENY